MPAHRVALWSGSAWSALGTGSGMTNSVLALTVDGSGNVYAGGEFFGAGGVAANQVAQWNGSTWSALGSGMSNTVWALAASGGEPLCRWSVSAGRRGDRLLRGQMETAAPGSALSGGMNGAVWALAVDGSGNLYAGGSFTTAGGVAAPARSQVGRQRTGAPWAAGLMAPSTPWRWTAAETCTRGARSPLRPPTSPSGTAAPGVPWAAA